jgi:hypothetical protein
MKRAVALLVAFSLSGCQSMADSLISGLLDSAWSSMWGESDQQRADRYELQGDRESWSTPGRTSYEIDTEARGTFRKVHGREPDINQGYR